MTTSKKKSVLGDDIMNGGLNALFGQQGIEVTTTPKTGDMIDDVAVDQILANPYQPRHTFDESALRDLASSIQENGILQPIIVRQAPKDAKKYEILAGERRWRATQLLGNKTIPAVIREYDDETMMQAAVLENLQREDLSPIEEALAYKQMMEVLHLTQEQVAKRLGKARSAIANTVRLLTLPDDVQGFIQGGQLSMGQGRTLLGLHNKRKIGEVAQKVMQDNLTVRQLEKLVNDLNEDQVPKATQPQATSDFIVQTQAALTDKFGTKVAVRRNKKGAGKIEINYLSDEELQRIFTVLGLDFKQD